MDLVHESAFHFALGESFQMGGASTAAEATPFRVGRVDDTHVFVFPILVGGGKPGPPRDVGQTSRSSMSDDSATASSICTTGRGWTEASMTDSLDLTSIARSIIDASAASRQRQTTAVCPAPYIAGTLIDAVAGRAPAAVRATGHRQ